MRGELESERNPTLLLELPRTLFKLNAQMPALEPLFQLPPEIGHMSRRLPLAVEYDPTADHSAKFIYEPADR